MDRLCERPRSCASSSWKAIQALQYCVLLAALIGVAGCRDDDSGPNPDGGAFDAAPSDTAPRTDVAEAPDSGTAVDVRVVPFATVTIDDASRTVESTEAYLEGTEFVVKLHLAAAGGFTDETLAFYAAAYAQRPGVFLFQPCCGAGAYTYTDLGGFTQTYLWQGLDTVPFSEAHLPAVGELVTGSLSGGFAGTAGQQDAYAIDASFAVVRQR